MAHIPCPDCGSQDTKKNGRDRHKRQRFLCRDCGKTFGDGQPPPPRAVKDMYIGPEKVRLIVHLLVEGTSVSATARIAQVHKETVLKVLVRMGEKCRRILDGKVRNVTANHIQADEVWTFVQKKQKRVKWNDPKSWGDAYCFIGLDAETKLVITHEVGKRDAQTAVSFIQDLHDRLDENCKPQVTTDGFAPYVAAIEDAFGGNVDYGQLIKQYQGDVEPGRERYSPGGLLAIMKSVITGNPDEDLISTSYVERQNRTVRMAVRRFTRLVDAFSKKLENLQAACALHFAHYNFCRVHMTLNCTPAMEAGLTDHIWEIEELLEAA